MNLPLVGKFALGFFSIGSLAGGGMLLLKNSEESSPKTLQKTQNFIKAEDISLEQISLEKGGIKCRQISNFDELESLACGEYDKQKIDNWKEGKEVLILRGDASSIEIFLRGRELIQREEKIENQKKLIIHDKWNCKVEIWKKVPSKLEVICVEK